METATNNEIIAKAAEAAEERKAQKGPTITDAWVAGVMSAKSQGLAPIEGVRSILAELKNWDEMRMLEQELSAKLPEEEAKEASEILREYRIKTSAVDVSDYLKDVKEMTDESKNFSTDLFPVLSKRKVGYKVAKTQFSPATFNLISGFPSSGKSAALCSIALEAIEQGRKILYITIDGSNSQLLGRIQLAAIARKYANLPIPNYDPIGAENEHELRRMGEQLLVPNFSEIPSFLFQYLHMIQSPFYDDDKFSQDADPVKRKIHIARRDGYFAVMEGLIGSGKLRVVDPRSLPFRWGWKDLEQMIKDTSDDTIVMLDYIQALDIYPKTRFREALESKKLMVSGLADIAETARRTIICAAQLSREKSSETELKPLEMRAMAETSELEKRCATAIGLARICDLEPGGETRFCYRIVKDRLAEATGQYYLENSGYPYYYVRARRTEQGGLDMADVGAWKLSQAMRAKERKDELKKKGEKEKTDKNKEEEEMKTKSPVEQMDYYISGR